jgi:hypothetical protein
MRHGASRSGVAGGRRLATNVRILLAGQPIPKQRRILQPAGFIDDLFDIHGDTYTFRDAARQSAGFSRLGGARRLLQARMNLGKNERDGISYCCSIHVFPTFLGELTLHARTKSRKTRAILWLLSAQPDHKILGNV